MLLHSVDITFSSLFIRTTTIFIFSTLFLISGSPVHSPFSMRIQKTVAHHAFLHFCGVNNICLHILKSVRQMIAWLLHVCFFHSVNLNNKPMCNPALEKWSILFAKILQCLIPLQLFSRTRLYDSLYKYFICTINIVPVYDVSFGQVLILDHQESYRAWIGFGSSIFFTVHLWVSVTLLCCMRLVIQSVFIGSKGNTYRNYSNNVKQIT